MAYHGDMCCPQLQKQWIIPVKFDHWALCETLFCLITIGYNTKLLEYTGVYNRLLLQTLFLGMCWMSFNAQCPLLLTWFDKKVNQVWISNCINGCLFIINCAEYSRNAYILQNTTRVSLLSSFNVYSLYYGCVNAHIYSCLVRTCV